MTHEFKRGLVLMFLVFLYSFICVAIVKGSDKETVYLHNETVSTKSPIPVLKFFDPGEIDTTVSLDEIIKALEIATKNIRLNYNLSVERYLSACQSLHKECNRNDISMDEDSEYVFKILDKLKKIQVGN